MNTRYCMGLTWLGIYLHLLVEFIIQVLLVVTQALNYSALRSMLLKYVTYCSAWCAIHEPIGARGVQ